MVSKALYLVVIYLLLAPAISAAQESEYRVTYTININSDGNAMWYVEYRTPLVSKEDLSSFDNYTAQLKQVYLKEFKDLMQRSVSDAANATSRKMVAGGFTGDAEVQSAPTGTYGIVRYSFAWTNFAKVDADKNINIGDVFVAGLYLSKDNMLVIQYPADYAVEHVAPQPDQVRDGLVWYGIRSFNSGEPAIALSKTSSSWMPLLIAISVISISAAGAFIYMRKARGGKAGGSDTGPAAESISETDMIALEDRIVNTLKESGGSLYQSEIGKKLNLPKSSVSTALNQLHDKKIIQKIKKGRENLIRLV